MGGATISLVGVGLVAAGGFVLVAGFDQEGRSTWRLVSSSVLIVAGVLLFIIGVVR